MSLPYKDEMDRMGLDEESLFELSYSELDYIVTELSDIYNSQHIDDLNSYTVAIIQKLLDVWQSIHLLSNETNDTSSLVSLTRMVADNYAVFCHIHINPTSIHERELRHYLYILDGLKERSKGLANFHKSEFDPNYVEQKEVDQLKYKIESVIESDKTTRNILLKRIHRSPLYAIEIEKSIITLCNWRYKRLDATTKDNRYSWEKLYQRAGIKETVSQFISGYMSEFVHGLCLSNIAYNTPPFRKKEILSINLVLINMTATAIKTLFNKEIIEHNIDWRKSEVMLSLLSMVSNDYLSDAIASLKDNKSNITLLKERL